MDHTDLDQIQRDQKIIADLGGPSKVAELLNFPKAGGQQRVQNWLARGIPPGIKVKRPDLFMKDIRLAQVEMPIASESPVTVVAPVHTQEHFARLAEGLSLQDRRQAQQPFDGPDKRLAGAAGKGA